jgi:hypothetical protein
MGAVAISANEVATPEVVEAILQGIIPKEWESKEGPGGHTNLPDANPLQLEVIRKGIELARVASTSEETTKDARIFQMPPKFALSQSLKEQGWNQWHTSVQTVSREECEKQGISYRLHRYPVHLWMSPEGGVALAKLKHEGKGLPLD